MIPSCFPVLLSAECLHLRHRPAARHFAGAYLADSSAALQSRRSNQAYVRAILSHAHLDYAADARFPDCTGWFAGTLHVRIAVLTALASNIINLLLDVLFVIVLHYEVTGVAAATCIANITGFLAILYFYAKHKPCR